MFPQVLGRKIGQRTSKFPKDLYVGQSRPQGLVGSKKPTTPFPASFDASFGGLLAYGVINQAFRNMRPVCVSCFVQYANNAFKIY